MILNKTINLEEDFIRPTQAITEARKILKEIGVDNLVMGERHYIYFDGLNTSDLVIVKYVEGKWIVKNCDDQEWLYYFYTYLHPPKERKVKIKYNY